MRSVVALGDIHFPFANRRALRKAIAYIRKHRPDVVIQMGDLYDMFSFGRFPRSVNMMTPRCEIKLGNSMAIEFWTEVYRAMGRKGKRFQLIGNHDERPIKKLISIAPEFEDLAKEGIDRLFRFDHVETQPSEREELEIDGVLYMHGYRKHGTHVSYNLQSTVCAHTHVGGVVTLRQRGKTLFELNCAYLGDPNSAPLSYTQQKKISKWTPGLGHITKEAAIFVPL